MGYHQIRASDETQEKLAFQGTDAIKWTYNVMPFGPTNGPATFVQMIHNVDSIWKQYAVAAGIDIGNDVDTTIIIDDIMNWATSFNVALKYIVCQLKICKAYRLTLSLKKSHFLPAWNLWESMSPLMEIDQLCLSTSYSDIGQSPT